MDAVAQVKSFHPWVSIWIKPRETIRCIVSTDPTRQVILLAALGGIAQSLDRAASEYFGDKLSMPVLLIMILALGPIGGVISLYILGALFRWTGSWFGGDATTEEVRAAIAWSNVPIIWALLLWIPKLALFGEELFKSATPRMDANLLLIILLFIFGIVELVIGIWTFIVFLKCLGEVHRFSVWKALGAVLVPSLVLIGIVFACVASINAYNFQLGLH